MLSRLASSLRKLAGGAERAGADRAGNQYFRQKQPVDGAEVERRWVKYKGAPDPRALPVEWISWLSNTRAEAPTPEEIVAMENHRKMVKYKASILQAEEEKRRFRAKSLKQGVAAEHLGPESMEKMMEHITDADQTLESRRSGPKPKRDGGIFQPGYWQPPESTSKS